MPKTNALIINQQDIENQVKAIAGNEPVLEKLYKLLDTKEAIAFVGAGASAGLWPLWDEFLTDFVDHSLKLGKITSDEVEYFKNEAAQNPLETAQQLRNKIGDRHYFEYLQETFKDIVFPQTDGAFTLTHKALLQLPIHNYLTLNYDAGRRSIPRQQRRIFSGTRRKPEEFVNAVLNAWFCMPMAAMIEPILSFLL